MSINKQKLLDILKSPKDMSDKDLEELEDMVIQYPYFQLGHSLVSKAKYDRQTPDAYASLSLAAIYAPDRSVLKKLFYDKLSIIYQPEEQAAVLPVAKEPVEEDEVADINENITEEEETTIVSGEVIAESEPTSEVKEVTNHSTGQTSVQEISDTPEEDEESKIKEEGTGSEKKEVDDAVYQELQKNLENLRKNKLKFDDEQQEDKPSDKKKTLIEPELPKDDIKDAPAEPPKITSADTIKTPREKGTSRLLTEISALQPLPAEQIRIKQQNQLSLIEKFITTQPEIVYRNQNDANTKATDLSEKSTLPKDQLLTENFAAIMLKQGKTDKAIEIYRKLIWKFPQKKAYFAAKVKALKESE